jgi:predicted PurR-regulated permease PerM
MYFGNIFIYIGFGVVSFSLFPYLQIIALIYFVLQYYCIVLNEEEYLNQQFNGFYEKYKRIVKRFFPKINTIPEDIHSRLSFNLSSGLKSEKRSIQAMVVTLMVIFLLYFSGFKLPSLF